MLLLLRAGTHAIVPCSACAVLASPPDARPDNCAGADRYAYRHAGTYGHARRYSGADTDAYALSDHAAMGIIAILFKPALH